MDLEEDTQCSISLVLKLLELIMSMVPNGCKFLEGRMVGIEFAVEGANSTDPLLLETATDPFKELEEVIVSLGVLEQPSAV